MINKKNKRVSFNIKKILNNIKIILTNYYGNKLKAIILYGSFARDEANSDSDLDIAIVFKGNIDKIAELERIHNLIYDILCDSNELISVYTITEKELEDLEWPLNYNISIQGITIWNIKCPNKLGYRRVWKYYIYCNDECNLKQDKPVSTHTSMGRFGFIPNKNKVKLIFR